MAVADWFSGFDYITTGDGTLLVSGINPLVNFQSNVSVSTSAARTGTRSLLCGSGAFSYICKTDLTSRTTYSLGFWLYSTSFATAANMCSMGEGNLATSSNAHISLRVTTGGNIQVVRGGGVGISQSAGTQLGSNSSNTLSINTGYHIVLTVFISDTVGTVTVKVNGSSTGWHEQTGLDTRNGLTGVITSFGLGGFNNGSSVFYDDVWMAASDLGDCRVTPINASTGDGSLADFTPSSGTDNGAMVDEVAPDGDTTYNSSTTAGNRDTYNFPASGILGATVHGVKVHNSCKKQDAGTVSMKPVIRISGVNYEGTEQFLPTTYGHVTQQYDVSPATASAWTVAEIDGAEFGIRHNA